MARSWLYKEKTRIEMDIKYNVSTSHEDKSFERF